jgi:predicted transposase/invertase (TIGR01784 family)
MKQAITEKKTEIIRFDWEIKTILRQKKNFGVLEGFLSELLKENISILEILESESNTEHHDGKINRVDLLVRTKDNSRIIIEVKSERHSDFLSRALFGASKAITDNIYKGDAYKDISRVISVNVLFFDLGKGKDYVYIGKTNFIGHNTRDKLKLNKNELKIYLPRDINEPSDLFPTYYLVKVNEFNEQIKNGFDEWLYFLKNEAVKSDFKAKGVHEAFETLEYVKLSQKERNAYTNFKKNLMHENSILEDRFQDGHHKGFTKGKQKGITEGRKKGRAEGMLEVAKNLLKLGYKFSQIVEATQLDIKYIEELYNRL